MEPSSFVSKISLILAALFFSPLATQNLIGMDLYVSLNGNDANSGAKDSPFASLAAARNAARTKAGTEAVTIHVADGVYYLPEKLTFAAADSGTRQFPVLYKAENEGQAILSGGSKLELTWQPHQDGIFKAQTPTGLTIDQVFINGVNQRMARYPNYDPAKKAQPYQGYAADAFSKKRAATWSDPTGGYIHSMHKSSWGGYHYRITGKNADGEVAYEGGWQNNRPSPMHKEYRMVENIFEELDTPGEWFHDAKSGTLYYYPAAGVDLAKASVEVVRLRHLIEFNGTESKPVKFISLQGFVVRHASRTFMDCKEPLLRSDWAIYRGGAVMLTGTEDVSIVDCEFDQVGGNAIFVNNYNRRTAVRGCHIHDTGASGVCFVGDPKAVRDPLFRYGQKNDLSKISRTPGPKTNNYPANSSVDDCLIHGIGRVERQPAGVQIEMAAEIAVRDCSVYDTARAGINIGDGAWGGHLIDRCDVFDTVLETHDHGSFNSWGRDRYWVSDHLNVSQKAVDKEPNLPFLDAIKTTVIRNSRWRCDHGWDIDLDDGSSNYDLYNNLMLGKGLKLREGFRRHAYNNVIPAGYFHPHVWFIRSNDQVSANIFANRHAPARMGTPYNDGETKVDRNLFTTNDPKILSFSKNLGWDENSVLGDPMYVDAAKGDFRVKEGSPALKLGFKNFPMDQFGVKKTSLKAIARTPEIPDLKNIKAPKPRRSRNRAKIRSAWAGTILKDLEGEEFSAYGSTKEAGGVALVKVTKSSAAAQAGLIQGDLVQSVNGKSVANVKQFLKAVGRTNAQPMKLKLLRNQKPLELSINPATTLVIESTQSSAGFKQLVPPAASTYVVTTNQTTANEPLTTLTDGKLAENFGPVFPNGTQGIYKMDLGSIKPISAINSWSFKAGGNRATQMLTVYASDSAKDPGWDLNKFIPIGTVDTGAIKANYAATSIRSAGEQPLGNYRWVIWAVSPISNNGGGENTAFQELAVETASVP